MKAIADGTSIVEMQTRFCSFFVTLLICWELLPGAASSQALTAAQWKEDLATLRTAIAAHPAPFRNVSKVEFERAADALAGDLPRLQDYQVVARMASLVALLQDGHSRVRLPVVEGAELFGSHSKIAEPKISPFGYFPIRLMHTADGLVVTRTTPEDKDLLGAQFTGIGRHSAAEAESAVLPIVSADNRFAQKYLAPNFMVIPEILAAVGIAPLADRVSWKFRLASGQEISRNLPSIHDSAPPKWIALTETTRPAPDSRHWITKLPGGIVDARLAEILPDPYQTVAEFAADIFTAVDKTPDATLVLDLRDNPGGDNTLDDVIVRSAIRSQGIWEPGRFFVLINPGTFSAASNLVTLLERWTPAIFVGEPTGGAPNGYGDPKKTVLPNSGVTVLVSSLYWQVSNPKDNRNATQPLFAAVPSVASARAHNDAALTLVDKMLRKPVLAGGRFSGQVAIGAHSIDLSFDLAQDRVTLDLPALQLAGRQLESVTHQNAVVLGTLTVGEHRLALHGRLTGRQFLGWIDLDGRPYAFATEQSAQNP